MNLGPDAMMHLEEHVEYPATKEELVKACEEMSDVPAEEKEWFMKNLPEGTYESADKVKAALGV